MLAETTSLRAVRRLAPGALVASIVLLSAAPLEARRRHETPAPAAPTDPAQAAAKEHYDRARGLFDQEMFEDALSEFQAAYEARPHPIVLLSIAECLERLERFPEALQKLEQYLHDR